MNKRKKYEVVRYDKKNSYEMKYDTPSKPTLFRTKMLTKSQDLERFRELKYAEINVLKTIGFDHIYG